MSEVDISLIEWDRFFQFIRRRFPELLLLATWPVE